MKRHPSKRVSSERAKENINSRGDANSVRGSTQSSVRILMMVVALGGAAYLATDGFKACSGAGEKSFVSFEPIVIDGMTFNIDPSWNQVFEKGEFGRSQLESDLRKQVEKLRELLGVDASFDLKLIPEKENSAFGGDVAIMMMYDVEKYEEDGVFEIKSIGLPSEMYLPVRLNAPTIFHELSHALRVSEGAFVLHEGFEEGLSESLELEAYPDDFDVKSSVGEVANPIDFLDAFPELESIALEQSQYGFREFRGKGASSLVGSVSLTHPIRRRAWERFLKNDEHPEREGFLRKLTQAQVAAGKPFWEIEDVLALGDIIDPKFSEWFHGEGAFQQAKSGAIARALVKDSKISLLLFDFQELKKLNENDPDLFEMVGIARDMFVNFSLKTGEELSLEFKPNTRGVIMHLDLGGDLEKLGVSMEIVDMQSIEVGFVGGASIPLRHI